MDGSQEPTRDIAHLGHFELLTPKPDESLWYFVELLGMEKVHGEGRSVYLRGWGDYAASTLKLTEAEGGGIGWSNGDYSHRRCYRFTDPDGHAMEIYYDEQKYVAPEHLR